MKKLILLAIFLGALNVQAYTPSLESLFRNGSNGAIGQNTSMAVFVLKKKQKGVEEADPEVKQSLTMEFTYKMLFSNENKNSSLVQVRYVGNDANAKAMSDVRYFPNLNFSTLRLTNEDSEKKFFYALLSSLVNNDGKVMIEFLKDLGASVKRNSELVDKEQLYYLGKYVKYLKLEDEAREGQENPMEPKDADSAKKLEEVFKRPFLTKSNFIKRSKEGSDFFWIAESDQFYAKFSHDNHKLLEMKVKTAQGDISVKCFNYILYGQDMQFPELVILKDLAGDEYLLNMKKVTNFTDTMDNFTKRVGNYKEDLEQSLNKESPLRPSFAL